MKSLKLILTLVVIVCPIIGQYESSRIRTMRNKISTVMAEKQVLTKERSQILQTFHGPDSIIKDLQQQWINIQKQLINMYRLYYEENIRCQGLKTQLSMLENNTQYWDKRNMEIPIDVDAYAALAPYLSLPYYDHNIKVEEQLVEDQQIYYYDYLKQKKTNDIISDGLLYKFNEANQQLMACQNRRSMDSCKMEEDTVKFYQLQFTNFRYKSIMFSLDERVPSISLKKFKQNLYQSLSAKQQAQLSLQQQKSNIYKLKKQCIKILQEKKNEIWKKIDLGKQVQRLIDEQLGVREIMLLSLKNKTTSLRMKTIELENLAKQFTILVKGI